MVRPSSNNWKFEILDSPVIITPFFILDAISLWGYPKIAIQSFNLEGARKFVVSVSGNSHKCFTFLAYVIREPDLVLRIFLFGGFFKWNTCNVHRSIELHPPMDFAMTACRFVCVTAKVAHIGHCIHSRIAGVVAIRCLEDNLPSIASTPISVSNRRAFWISYFPVLPQTGADPEGQKCCKPNDIHFPILFTLQPYPNAKVTDVS